MRYRTLDPDGDYTFGRGPTQILANTPETVAQAILTRLALWSGEWFLDTDEGTPYLARVLGAGTANTYDAAIQERILDTPGVVELTAYASVVDGRALSIQATVATIYGETTLQTGL